MNKEQLQICLETLDLAYRHIATQIQQAGVAVGAEGRTKLEAIENTYNAVKAELDKE